MKSLLSGLCILLISSLCAASQYPADRARHTDCQILDEVQICRLLHDNGTITLEIALSNSPLLSTYNNQISVFVKINYQPTPRSNHFPMTIFDNTNGTQQAQVRITNGCLAVDLSEISDCQIAGTPEMKDLLFWAVRTERTLNALALEIAFVDQNHNWDSKFGANYHFYFPEVSYLSVTNK